jgi:hypothetical protein
MDSETYTLAPSVIADKARSLASQGLYQQALELLERNRVIAEVHPTYVEMRLSSELNSKDITRRDRFLNTHRMVKTQNRLRHKGAKYVR